MHIDRMLADRLIGRAWLQMRREVARHLITRLPQRLACHAGGRAESPAAAPSLPLVLEWHSQLALYSSITNTSSIMVGGAVVDSVQKPGEPWPSKGFDGPDGGSCPGVMSTTGGTPAFGRTSTVALVIVISRP